MKCYTYTDGQLLEGCLIRGRNQKTCAFTLTIPLDWDTDTITTRLKSQEFCDTMLYGVADICEGDSISSVFPKSCVAVLCRDVLHIHNDKNSCAEMVADAERTVYVLFTGSTLTDTVNKVSISNVDGTLSISALADDVCTDLPPDGEDAVISL